MMKIARFSVGARVLHQQHGYRAVVIDVDPLFQASGRYNPQVIKREFANRYPWYRLLVDGSSQITYVEECLLQMDESPQIINNPKLSHYLKEQQGHYISNATWH